MTWYPPGPDITLLRTVSRPLRLWLPGAFASHRPGLRALARQAGIHSVLDFHRHVPTGDLAAGIIAGGRASFFISANDRYVAEVQAAGRVADTRPLAGNRLVIIALPESPVHQPEDLARPEIRVITPQAGTDPCGQYILTAWQRAGWAETMAAKEAAGTLVHSHGSGDLPGRLFGGAADCGVFYASEALLLGERVRTIPLPPPLDLADAITFHGAVIRTEGQVHPDAPRLLDTLAGPAGAAWFHAAGFTPPPDR